MNEKQLRDKLVKKAVSYLGTKAGSARHKNIVDTYNKIVPLPAGYKVKYTDPWCATFVSFCASVCDMLDIIPAECGCSRQIELWQKLGRWQERDSYVPQTGDIIYFDWDDSGKGDNTGWSDHVGIVVSVSGGKIKTIEGNKSNAVGYRTIAVDGKYIRGYGLPDFASKSTEDTKMDTCNVELNVLAKGCKGDSVKALQILLKGYGYSIGSSGVDGSFGPSTLSAVKKYQKDKGLSVDGSVGPATWKSLLG